MLALSRTALLGGLLVFWSSLAVMPATAQTFDDFTEWKGTGDLRINDLAPIGENGVVVVGTARGQTQISDNQQVDMPEARNGLIIRYANSGFGSWQVRYRAQFNPQSFQSNPEEVAVDTADNIYVTGWTDAEVNIGGGSSAFSGSDRVRYVAKYRFNGDLIWAADFPRQNFSSMHLLVGRDRYYLYGRFQGTVDFNPRGPREEYTAVGEDVFVACYSLNGYLNWVDQLRELERPGQPWWNGQPTAGLDRNHDFCLALASPSRINLQPSNNVLEVFAPDSGAIGTFVARYDGRSGFLKEWITYPGQLDGRLNPEELFFDHHNRLFLAGSLEGPVDLSLGAGSAGTQINVAEPRAFLSRYTTGFSHLWTNYWQATDYIGPRYANAGFDGRSLVFMHTTAVGDFDLNPAPGDTQLVSGSSDRLTFAVMAFDTAGVFQWGDAISSAGNAFNSWGNATHGLGFDHVHNAYCFGAYRGTQQVGEPTRQFITNSTNGLSGDPSLDGYAYRMQNCLDPDPQIVRRGDWVKPAVPVRWALWVSCAGDTLINLPNQGPITDSVLIPEDGSYALAFETYNGCWDTTACFEVLNVGIDHSSATADFLVFPNPASDGWFTLRTTRHEGAQTVLIRNLAGQEVQRFRTTGLETRFQLAAPAGVYFLQVENRGDVLRLVKW